MRSARRGELQRLRSAKIALIQQDLRNSLNPVRRIGASIRERLVAVRGIDRRTAMDRAEAMLEAVGIRNVGQICPSIRISFSGGMLQRVVIAAGLMAILNSSSPTRRRVLSMCSNRRPKSSASSPNSSVAADCRCSSSLDDLHLASSMCDRVAVMRAGSLVEELAGRELFESAGDPYTLQMLEATPILGGLR